MSVGRTLPKWDSKEGIPIRSKCEVSFLSDECVYILVYCYCHLYIIKKIPNQHTLRSTVVQLFFHFMPYKIMTKFCKSCNRCQLNYPKCLRGSQPCPPPPCFIYFITLRQHYFPNLPKTDLTLVFWLTPYNHAWFMSGTVMQNVINCRSFAMPVQFSDHY